MALLSSPSTFRWTTFSDSSIKAIICMVGGDDTIRLLPYIDYEIIKNNPKIFMGYSDTTVNHFMMYKAGLVSFYGPCLLVEFAENKEMHKYTIDSIFNTLFNKNNALEIKHSPLWTSEYLDWCDKSNMNISRKLIEDKHSYEILQGSGIVQGKLIGGCLDVFCMIIGTEIWPSHKEFENSILFLETSEDCPSPNEVCYFLRNLVAQGIIDKINGIIIGKPLDEKYYEEYKEIYIKVIGKEAKRPDLPILYNVNFGHNAPQSIIPYGVMAQIDCTNKTFSIIENSLI
jgi:muramoyltetrapeptide carboxypeptidase LdcA involved in peptidoglycan recycling